MPIPEPVSHEVLRAALLSMFTRSRKPVLLLVAPGGYGKTVAVAQWMRIEKVPCVWITERPGSTRSEALIGGLFRQLHGLRGSPAPDHRPTLEGVLDLLENLQDPPLKLVFDGLKGYTPEAMHTLARICRHLMGGQQAILCSRSPKLLGFQGLFIKQQIEVFTANHLAFTLQECEALLGRPYPEQEYERSLGWCQEVCNQHLRQFVYDPAAYLTEMAQELEEPVRSALLVLLQKDVWQEEDFPQRDTLWKLLESGLPLLPTDLLHYRVHPLLQGWLLDQQDPQLPADSLDVGVAVQLVRRMVAADQHDLLLPWLEKTVREWLKQEQFDGVVTLLETLKPDALTPFLRTALAEAHLDLAHLETSERLLLEQVQDQQAISRTFLNLARLAGRRNRMEEYRHMLEQGKRLAMDPEDELRLACEEVGYHQRMGQLQEALDTADRCLTLARSTGLQELLILSHCRMAHIERLMGHQQAVEYHTGEALRFALQQGMVNKAAPAVNTLADQQKDLGEFQKGLENITRAINAMHGNKHPYEGVLYATRGLIFTELGNFPEALKDFRESLRLFGLHQNHAAAMLPATFLCYVLYRLGHFEELNSHFAQFEGHIQQTPTPNNQDGREDYFPLAQGIHLYANGKKREALLVLEKVRVSRRNGWLDSVLLSHLLKCKIKHEFQEVQEPDADLLIEIIGHRDSGIMVGMYSEDFEGVLQHFIDQGWHSGVLKKLIQQTRPSFNPIQKIHIEMLEKPRLWVGNREIKIPNYYPVMALIYLHLHRDRFSTSMRIADHLWREDLQDRQTRNNRVSAAFSMLKKILRDVDVSYEDLVIRDPREGWRLNGRFEVTSDLDPYMDWDPLPLDRQMELLHRLQKPFFNTITTDWAESVREQLRESAALLAREIAGDLAIKGQMQEALEVLELGLNIDPHAFELMEQGIGYARAARQFERAAELSQLLNQELGKNMTLKHHLTHHTLKDFSHHLLQHLHVQEGVCLETGCHTGTLTSPEIPAEPFKSLILSWQARAPQGSTLEVAVRVQVAGEWSGFYSYGDWSETSRGSRRNQKDDHGDMDTDVLKLFAPATRYQYRVTFHRHPGMPSPVLHEMTVLTTGEQDFPSHHHNKPTAWGVELQVPPMSQLTYEEGAGWCSPTCLKMVLGYHGVDASVPELAQRVYDSTYRGTGNWVFNTAAVALYGLRGYVHRLTGLSEAETYIARGIPLIISISWKEGELQGAPLPRSPGHLLLLAGFTEHGEVIVRDPAAVHVSEVRRIYRRSELQKVWLRHSQGMCYVIEPVTKPPGR